MNLSVRPRSTLLSGLVPGLLLVLLLISTSASAEQEQGFSEGELAQMLAPIALYPDALLSQILMASTYPLEVVEAARWSRQNPDLEGSAAVDAVADQDWDPSVKALVAFPRILARMSDDLAWTRNLGDAFLLQEAEVADTIQTLRWRADEAGNLDGQEHIRVVRDREVIVIEPADPRVVYVPYYQPTVVYGGWWWPAYAPVYWYPPYGYTLSFGITWVSGIPVSHGFFFSTFSWPHRHVVIVRAYDRHRHLGKAHPGGHRWVHNPWHRRGVSYRHATLQTRYSGHRTDSGAREVIRPGTGSRFSGSPTAWQDRGTQRRGDSQRVQERSRTGWNRDGRDSDTGPGWQDRNTQRRADSQRTTRERLQQDGTRPGWQDRHTRESTTWSRDSGNRSPVTRESRSDTDRITTRRPAAPGPNALDRSDYRAHTESTRRSLEARRPRIEQRDSTQGGTTRQYVRPDQRPDSGQRAWQRPDSARSGGTSRDGQWQNSRRESGRTAPPRAEGERTSGRPDGGAWRGGNRDSGFTRPAERAGQGQRSGWNRGEARGSFGR